ncbi:MAG: hypothetical protein RLZZ297_221 [Chloroflexota bacterium]|jgi:hypothetical protein
MSTTHTRPLAEILGRTVQPGIAPTPRAAFILEKPARDRIVLLEPALAPLFRRYVGSEDIQRYACVPSSKYLLALPSGWTSTSCGASAAGLAGWDAIADCHPALARHLALPVADRPKNDSFWWELPADTVLPGRDRAVITMEWNRTLLWCTRTPVGSVSAAEWIDCDADWVLGYLNALPVQRYIQAARAANPRWTPALLDQLPVPTLLVDDPTLTELAAQNARLHQERVQLLHDGLATLIRNFAPLGAQPTAPLQRWVELDYPALNKALAKAFRNDIPIAVQPQWQQWHELQRQRYSELSQQVSFVDGALTKAVTRQLPLE